MIYYTIALVFGHKLGTATYQASRWNLKLQPHIASDAECIFVSSAFVPSFPIATPMKSSGTSIIKSSMGSYYAVNLFIMTLADI